jgi:hypothetical protein
MELDRQRPLGAVDGRKDLTRVARWIGDVDVQELVVIGLDSNVDLRVDDEGE